MDKKRTLLIHSAKQVVTPLGHEGVAGQAMNRLQVIENGAVLMVDGRIKEVGTTEKVLESMNDIVNIEMIDASNHILLPGFVDSHTHFIFSGDRWQEYTWRLEGESYMDIHRKGGGIWNTVKATRLSTFEELFELGIERLNQGLQQGITTIEGKSGYGLDWSTERKQLQVMKAINDCHPITVVPTFMAAHSMPTDFAGTKDEYIETIIHNQLPHVVEENLAKFCDVFCEAGVFSVEQSRSLLQAAKDLGLEVKLHADEVVDTQGAGLAAELGARSADHLLMSSEVNLKKMQQSDVVATLLPITAFSLNEPYPNVKLMMQNGLKIALASDYNPGSSNSQNISFLVALATRQMGMSIESVITALTLNGAAALGLASEIGSLEVGKKADIVLHQCPDYHHLAYHLAHNHVSMVIKDGNVVYDQLRSREASTEKQSFSNYSNYSVEQFLDETASSNPVPGGGSIAAHSGATAAALVEMVANLTINRKKYSEVQGDMENLIETLHPLRKRLLELVDEDALSYHQVMTAYALPKETDDQRLVRSTTIQTCLKLAAQIPFEVATLTRKVLDMAEFVVIKGNSNAITDGIVASMLSRTAILSAFYNVKINLSSITDGEFVAKYESQIAHITEAIETQEAKIRKKMQLQ